MSRGSGVGLGGRPPVDLCSFMGLWPPRELAGCDLKSAPVCGGQRDQERGRSLELGRWQFSQAKGPYIQGLCWAAAR